MSAAKSWPDKRAILTSVETPASASLRCRSQQAVGDRAATFRPASSVSLAPCALHRTPASGLAARLAEQSRGALGPPRSVFNEAFVSATSAHLKVERRRGRAQGGQAPKGLERATSDAWPSPPRRRAFPQRSGRSRSPVLIGPLSAAPAPRTASPASAYRSIPRHSTVASVHAPYRQPGGELRLPVSVTALHVVRCGSDRPAGSAPPQSLPHYGDSPHGFCGPPRFFRAGVKNPPAILFRLENSISRGVARLMRSEYRPVHPSEFQQTLLVCYGLF